MQFAERAMSSFWAPSLLGGVVGLVAGPSFLLLLGSCVFDLVAAGETVRTLALPAAPAVANIIDKVAEKALPPLAGRSAEELASYSRARKWEAANAGLSRLGATADVWGTLMIFLELLTPQRSLMGALLGYQMQTAKYSLSEPHRQVWAGLHLKIRSLASRFPPVLKGFDALAALLRKQVRNPDDLRREAEERYRQEQAGGGSGAPGKGCNIQ
jgi:hypothetical protein